MNILKKIKSNKGISLSDIIIALLILIMFTGILTTAYYNIYTHNLDIRCDAIATNLAIIIAEDIDKMMYKDVTEDLNNTINQKFEKPDEYNITINVEKKYKSDDTEKLDDKVKLVKINISYNILNEDKIYTIQKLKIKEV